MNIKKKFNDTEKQLIILGIIFAPFVGMIIFTFVLSFVLTGYELIFNHSIYGIYSSSIIGNLPTSTIPYK
jgi:hypothetical protein